MPISGDDIPILTYDRPPMRRNASQYPLFVPPQPPAKKRRLADAMDLEESPWTSDISQTESVVLLCECLPKDKKTLLELHPVATAFEERPIAVVKIRGINLRVWEIADDIDDGPGSESDESGEVIQKPRGSTSPKVTIMDLDEDKSTQKMPED